MATIARRPSDIGRGCDHCLWAHNKNNMLCTASTGIVPHILPSGTLVEIDTGYVISGKWRIKSNTCVSL